MTARRRAPPDPIRPDRVRGIQGSFAFLPGRLLHDGFLAALTCDEIVLYVFLVLAADRRGLSFYSYDRICTTLHLRVEDYVEARNRLIELDLLAFDGTRFQILSLPATLRPRTSDTRAPARRDAKDLAGLTSLQQALRSLLDDA